MSTQSHFAAVADSVIYGIGHTEESAYQSAANGAGYPTAELWRAAVAENGYADFKIIPMSESAYHDVDRDGFDGNRDGYQIVDGVIGTIDRPLGGYPATAPRRELPRPGCGCGCATIRRAQDV